MTNQLENVGHEFDLGNDSPGTVTGADELKWGSSGDVLTRRKSFGVMTAHDE